MTSPSRDVEVNVVSSPESNSRNASPEPNDAYNRLINRSSSITTCFPVIKTSEDEEKDAKATATQKNSGGTTNFSISSILSRTEPTAKKNGFMSGASGGQGLLESAGFGGGTDNAVLSR